MYVTGLVDLEAKVVIDMVEGNAAADLRRWTAKADPGWLCGIEVVATDLAESFRAGLSPHLDHARRVADPFHVVRAGNGCLDKVRCRVQNETLGHRGRKRDPLYRTRKLLLSGHERHDEVSHQRMLLGLRVGDPADEVLGAWLAKESVRDVYLAEDRAEAALLLDKAIAGCADDDVEEVRSLGNTLARWRSEVNASSPVPNARLSGTAGTHSLDWERDGAQVPLLFSTYCSDRSPTARRDERHLSAHTCSCTAPAFMQARWCVSTSAAETLWRTKQGPRDLPSTRQDSYWAAGSTLTGGSCRASSRAIAGISGSARNLS